MAAVSSAQPDDANGSSSSRARLDFSATLATWKDINLPDLQTQLNSIAPAVLESQTTAVINRKKLAEQTRDFKKQPDEEKLESFKPLLKSYQTEIDTLTKRSKSAENAFLNVHSALTTAPDPYPLLEVIVEQAAALNDLESLKQENGALKQEVASLQESASKRSADDSERQVLQNRIHQLEEGFETKLQQRSIAFEKELSAKWDERIRNLDQREKDLTSSLNVAQEQLRELRSRDESTTAKLLERGHEDDEREVKGRLAEIELLTRDLERAQTRVESTERRNEQLRSEIESVKNGRQENDKMEKMEREAEERLKNLAQLQSLVDKERQESALLTKRMDTIKNDNLKVVKERDSEISSLRGKLQQRHDYAEVKRELDVLKMVHFTTDDDEDTGTANGNNVTEAQAKPLETLLLEKNKKLEDQLTTLRVSHSELSGASTDTQGELSKLHTELTRLKSLNEKLENDLVSVGKQGRLPKNLPAMSAEDALKEMDLLEAEASGKGSGLAKSQSKATAGTPIQREESANQQSTPRATASVTPSNNADSSILPIITSQRDRFRSRNAELEEELRKQFETISELRAEVKTLQADNLSLYEKMRYLQSYGPGGSNGRGGSGGDSVINIGKDGTGADGAYPPPRVHEDKYRAKYEDSMNPFQAFRGREQSRAMAQLNPLERALHILTRLVLSHRNLRLLFMVYAIFLHLMVFGMLFEVSHTSSAETCVVKQNS